MRTHNSRDAVVSLSALYATAITIFLSFIPSFSIGYLYFFQDPQLRFTSHLGHEIAIMVALCQSAFIAWIAWRCFQYSGERFLRWLAWGFWGFTIIYACHGIFTRMASTNIWQFVLYGPASRLTMVSCFFVGLLMYERPNIALNSRAGYQQWLIWLVVFLSINILVFNLAESSWAPRLQRALEICSLAVSLFCIFIVIKRGIGSPLMTIFTVSLLFFAQSSAAFLLSAPWNHIWWLAHVIFAIGFIILSYGVIRAFLTTRSFALVFSQEELMARVGVEKERAEKALGEMQLAHWELGATNDLLQSVLAAASEFGIIATDTSGVITIFNSGAERMLGYQAGDLIGQHTPALFHVGGEVAARGKELSEEFGRPVSGFKVFVLKSEYEGKEAREWTYVHKDGHRFPVILVVTTMRSTSGKITGYLGIAENITERKRLANIKSEFLATVSHELRTPLTSISGSLELIAGGALGPVPEAIAQMLNIAGKNSQRLKLLIDDLLDIEKITAGQLNFNLTWQPLLPLITQTIETLSHYGAEKKINVVFHSGDCVGTEVRVEALRLQQVITNLLSNAIKFSPKGSTVEVSVKASTDKVRVEVADQGSGIPLSFRGAIFQRFSQADSSDTRKQGGSGLGLAITRELIEHMEGWVGYESVPGDGATFWFELPLKKTEVPAGPLTV